MVNSDIKKPPDMVGRFLVLLMPQKRREIKTRVNRSSWTKTAQLYRPLCQPPPQHSLDSMSEKRHPTPRKRSCCHQGQPHQHDCWCQIHPRLAESLRAFRL